MKKQPSPPKRGDKILVLSIDTTKVSSARVTQKRPTDDPYVVRFCVKNDCSGMVDLHAEGVTWCRGWKGAAATKFLNYVHIVEANARRRAEQLPAEPDRVPADLFQDDATGPRRIQQMTKMGDSLVVLDEDGQLWHAAFFEQQMIQVIQQKRPVEWRPILGPG